MNGTERDPAAARRAAEALYAAQVEARAVDPVRDALGDRDLDAAYEVQERVIALREAQGSRRVGRKVGLTSPAVQRQLGVEQPDFGVLLSDMDASGWDAIDSSRLVAPRIEAEIAFILGRDVDRTDRASVLAAVESVAAALEIVDSRVRDWRISIVDTIADNASSALFVLGDARLPLDRIEPAEVRMSMSEDGEAVSRGDGRACLGDPLTALVWVAETAARLGRPLRAGEVVLSGALGPMVPFERGRTYEARLTGLGSVTAIATGGEA